MEQPCFVLLPGLDGTGGLFRPLIDAMPSDAEHAVLSYPLDRPLSYDELQPVAAAQVPRGRPVVLVAESFSGPIALRYAAAAEPGHVRAVVLCASFVRSPVPPWVRHVARPVLFRRRPPRAAVRALLAGWDAPAALLGAFEAAVSSVTPEVMSARVREVIAVDAVAALAACTAPLLYLRASRDRLVGVRAAQHVMTRGAGVTVRTIDGPHLLLQASPAAAWREIAAFVVARDRAS
jgi:pimeloyl-ACP methyl ester carboxylesterase